MDKKYYSAVDWWLAALLIAAPLIPLGIGLAHDDLPLLLIGLFTGIVIALIAIPCHYTLTTNSLIVRCGLIKQTLPLEKIHNAEKSCNPLSSPALSLKRVKIIDANGKLLILISPKDRDTFIADLKSRLAQR